MPWEPILDGPAAAAALARVHEIAAALTATPGDATPAERALFWAYAVPVLGDAFGAAYDAALDEVAAALQRGTPSPGLHGGLAGAGFALAHVVDDIDDVLAVIDDSLLELLEAERWTGPFDVASGLAGLGVYFLERGDAGVAPLAQIVAHLERLATRTDAGLAWRTTGELVPEVERVTWPEGYFDCGVAHGTPGVLAMLARAGARPLAEAAQAWLAQQRTPAGFPNQVGGVHARDGWCYGDPGVAAAMWRVDPALARETALAAARRDPASAGVKDAMLCHGAAGLAHLYNRFYQASGDLELRDAARAWFGRALELGTLTWRDGWTPVTRLADGTVGLGLALVAAIAPAEPLWDRLLLCDVPPRG